VPFDLEACTVDPLEKKWDTSWKISAHPWEFPGITKSMIFSESYETGRREAPAASAPTCAGGS
jgi:hypothetical protein